MALKILKYPNTILDTPSQKVNLPLTPEVQTLIRGMWDTVEDDGIGLAAPQVGQNLQLCIIHIDPEIKHRKDKILDFVMINPEIIFYSQTEKYMVEGCLSFPEQYYEILRPESIRVKFQTITNFQEFLSDPNTLPQISEKELLCRDWMARVIQHEVDHLNGKLFINKGGRKLEPKELEYAEVVTD